MSHLYGDSTPFPHGADFIEAIRAATDFAVSLMVAQDALVSERARLQSALEQGEADRSKLSSIPGIVESGIGPLRSGGSVRVGETLARIQRAVVSAVEAELLALGKRETQDVAAVHELLAAQRSNAWSALETFMRRHNLPETTTGLKLSANGESYNGELTVHSPFGVEACFSLDIPSHGQWSALRQVSELMDPLELSLPEESGVFSKRTVVKPVRLDRLTIDMLATSPGRFHLALRRGPRLVYRIDVVMREQTEQPQIEPLGERGERAAQPLQLEGQDAALILRLKQQLLSSVSTLGNTRRMLVAATFDGKSIKELDEPQAIVAQLIPILAPIVREIESEVRSARRAGPPKRHERRPS